MPARLLDLFGVSLLAGLAALAPDAAGAESRACAATASQPTAEPRILQAIDEARRQHALFGGQTIERNGGLFRVSHHEAEWDRPPGATTPTWERVATFWRALSDADPPALVTTWGRVARSEALPPRSAAAGSAPTRAEVAVRESVLRAAIVDTPWSAVFISYLMKTAGLSHEEFRFSDTHADYVRAAFDASAAETAGHAASHAFRACDLASTRPRAGDLLCATRATAVGITRFDALPAAMGAAALAGQGFPMHCDLVVRADAGGDAKLETIGGNVVQSVTLSRMTLDAGKLLSRRYFSRDADAARSGVAAAGPGGCARGAPACPQEHLSRRPWVVLLQYRH